MEDAGRSLLDVINDPDALNLFLESPGDGEVSTSNGLCELDSLSPLLGTDPWSPTAPNPPAVSSMGLPMPAPSPQMGSVAPSPLGVAPSPSSSQGYRQAPSPLTTSRTSSPLETQQSFTQPQILQQGTQHLNLAMAPQQQITLATSPQVVFSQSQQTTLGQSQQVAMTNAPQAGTMTFGLGQQFIQQQPLLQQQIALASTTTSSVQPVPIQSAAVMQNIQAPAVQPNVVNLNLNQMRPVTSTLQIRPQGSATVPQVSVPGQVSLQGTIIQTASGNRILIQGQPLLQGQPINLAALQNLQQIQLRAPGVPASQTIPGQTPLQNPSAINIAATNPQTVNPTPVSVAGSLGIQPTKVGSPAVVQPGVNVLNLGQAQGQQIMIQRPAGTGAAPNQNIILRTLPPNLIIQAPGAQQTQLAGQTQLLVSHPTQLQPGQIQIQPAFQQPVSASTATTTTTSAQLPQQMQTITGQVLGMPSSGLNLQPQIKTESPIQNQTQNITLQNLGGAQGLGNKSQSIQIQAQNVNIQGQNVNLLTPSHASTLQKGLLTGTIKVNVGGQNLTLQQIKQLGLPQLKGMNLLAAPGGTTVSTAQLVTGSSSATSAPTLSTPQLGVAGSQPQVLLSSQGGQPAGGLVTTSGQQFTAQPTLIQGPGGIQQIVLQQSAVTGQPPVLQPLQMPQAQPQQMPSSTTDSHVMYQQVVKEEKPSFLAPSPVSASPVQVTSAQSVTPVTTTQSAQPSNFECILSAAAAQSGIADLLTPAENNMSAPQASATGATISYKPAKMPSSEPQVSLAAAGGQQSMAQQSLQAPPNVNIQQVQLNNLMPTVNTVGPPNAVAPGVQIIPKIPQSPSHSQPVPKPTFQSLPTATSSLATPLTGTKLTVAQLPAVSPVSQTSVVNTVGSRTNVSIALPQVSPVIKVEPTLSGTSVIQAATGSTTVPRSNSQTVVSTAGTPSTSLTTMSVQSSPLLASTAGGTPQVQTIQLTLANQQMLAKIQQQIKVLIAIPKRTDQQQKWLQQLAEAQKKILIHGRLQAIQTQQQQVLQNQPQQMVTSQKQTADAQQKSATVQQQGKTQQSGTRQPLATSQQQTSPPSQMINQQQQLTNIQQELATQPPQATIPQQVVTPQQQTTAQQPIAAVQQQANTQPQPIIIQPQSSPQPQLITLPQHQQPVQKPAVMPQQTTSQSMQQTSVVAQDQQQVASLQQPQVNQQVLQQQLLQMVSQPSHVVQASGKPAVVLSTSIPFTTVTTSVTQRALAPNLPKVLPNLTPKTKLANLPRVSTTTVLTKPQTSIQVVTPTGSVSTAVTSAQKLIHIKPLLPGQMKSGDTKVAPATQVIAMATTSSTVPTVGKLLVAANPAVSTQAQPVKVSQIAIPAAMKEKLMAYLSRMTPEQQQVFLKNPQALVLKLQQAQLLKQQMAGQQLSKGGPLKPLLANPLGAGDAAKIIKPQPMNKTTFIMAQLGRDQREATAPDTKLPFKNRKDACKRLLRFHVYQDHNVDLGQEAREDDQFEVKAQELLEKKQQMLNKYRLLLFDEARRVEPTSEMVMLHRMFLNDERKVLETDRKLVKDDPESFVPQPILTVGSPLGSSSPIMAQAVMDTETTPSPSSSPLHPSSSPSSSPLAHSPSSRELKRKLDIGASGWEESPNQSNASPGSYTLHSSGGLKLVFKNSPSHLRSPAYTPPDIKEERFGGEVREKKPKIKSEPMTPKGRTQISGYSEYELEDQVKSEPPSPVPHDSWGPGSPSQDSSWEQGPEELQNGADPDILDDFLQKQSQEVDYTEPEPYSITTTSQMPFQGYSHAKEPLDPSEVNDGGVGADLSMADSSISSVVDIDSQGANEDTSLQDTSQGDISEEDSAVAGLLSDCGGLGSYSQSQESVSYNQPLESVIEEYEQPVSNVTYTQELDNFPVDPDHSVIQQCHHRTDAYEDVSDMEGREPLRMYQTSAGRGHQGEGELESAVDSLMADLGESPNESHTTLAQNTLNESALLTSQPSVHTGKVVYIDSDDEEFGQPDGTMMSSPLGFLDSSGAGLSFDEDNLNVEMQSAINSILSLQQPSIPNMRVDSNNGSVQMTTAATGLSESDAGLIMYEDISDPDTSQTDMADDLDAAVQSIQFLM